MTMISDILSDANVTGALVVYSTGAFLVLGTVLGCVMYLTQSPSMNDDDDGATKKERRVSFFRNNSLCLSFSVKPTKNDVSIGASNDENGNDMTTLDPKRYPGGYLTILFGSQTGTAEQFANTLKREGEEDDGGHGFKVRVIDLDDITNESSVEKQLLDPTYQDSTTGKTRAIFLTATYGEGEPTDNAIAFVKWMKQKTEEAEGNADNDGPSYFRDLEFAVFGLGNRQYEHFNAMGKFFDSTLSKLGATRIMELGLGDDDEDLEGDFEQWKDDKLWPTLKERYHVVNGAGTGTTAAKADENAESSTTDMVLPSCPYGVEYINGMDPNDIVLDEIDPDTINKSTKHYFTAVDCPVTFRRELRSPMDGGSTLHVELDVSAKNDHIKYETADNMAVLPMNDSSIVERVAKALGYDLDAVFRLVPSSDAAGKSNTFHHLFPTPCTVRECLTRYCDLVTPPRRSELKQLAHYTSDKLDRKALERMGSTEHKMEYKDKIVDQHVGIADLISGGLCKSIAMPLEHFIMICPRLQPRFYTISSSSSLHPDTVHLTVSIMKGSKQDGSGDEWTGVCTNHIANIDTSNGTCRVFVRNSSFRLPQDVTRPILMIGPGTGIAPMRALLQERSYQRHHKKISNVGESVLYFGCKERIKDYLYEDELEEFQSNGTLTKLYVAFSRESEDGKKVYVQHLLKQNAAETFDLIHNKGAYIYVCGGTKMGADVTQTITDILSDELGLVKAKDYINTLRNDGRFVQELWSA